MAEMFGDPKKGGVMREKLTFRWFIKNVETKNLWEPIHDGQFMGIRLEESFLFVNEKYIEEGDDFYLGCEVFSLLNDSKSLRTDQRFFA